MNKNKVECNKIYANDLLFVIAYAMFITSVILDSTVITQESLGNVTVAIMITKIMRYCAYMICIIKIIMQTIYENKQLCVLAVSVFVLGLSFLGSGNKTMVLYTFIFVAAIGVTYDIIIKTSVVTQGLLLITFVVGSQLGLFLDYVRDDGNRSRHFLGFSWTTTSAILFLFIILQYIYIKKGNISWREGGILALTSLYFYVMTDSRFAFFVCTFTLLFFLCCRKIVNNGSFLVKFKGLAVVSPWFIALFAIVLHMIYSPTNNLLYKLNDLLSGRLRLGQNAINTYGFHLKGNKIEWIGYSISEKLQGVYNYVDCSYIQLALEHGVLFLLLVLLIYSVVIYNAISKKKYYLGWVLIIILLFSITEPRLFNLAYNPFILLVLAEGNNYG